MLGDAEPRSFSAEAVGEEDGEVTFEFSRSVAEIESEMAAHLDQLEASGAGSAPRISMEIDPREMRIIAFLYDRRTGAVLSADEIVPEGIPGDELRVLDADPAPSSAGGR